MSRLSIDQKTIKELLTDKRSDFLIPDYQRPYAWSEDECSTLWDDLFTFAIPNGDCEAFDTSSEYFLGPIVTFKTKTRSLKSSTDSSASPRSCSCCEPSMTSSEA